MLCNFRYVTSVIQNLHIYIFILYIYYYLYIIYQIDSKVLDSYVFKICCWSTSPLYLWNLDNRFYLQMGVNGGRGYRSSIKFEFFKIGFLPGPTGVLAPLEYIRLTQLIGPLLIWGEIFVRIWLQIAKYLQTSPPTHLNSYAKF